MSLLSLGISARGKIPHRRCSLGDKGFGADEEEEKNASLFIVDLLARVVIFSSSLLHGRTTQRPQRVGRGWK
jgi:hypothetical protein